MGKGGRDDAIDEGKVILCCALGCFNLGLYKAFDAIGCSGKAGLCCVNMECCCKGGAPYLFPFGCLGLRCECDGCSCINAQCHTCCLVGSAAIPCNKEVPVALVVLGLDLYPKMGCCKNQLEMMVRE
ncbi:hypothetical protein MPSEU_001026700 [Mayamaea pseudoterrestris]|nr:hypothetical protein MPSEU_001026700 [Mayamaea pseudoterrestris]